MIWDAPSQGSVAGWIFDNLGRTGELDWKRACRWWPGLAIAETQALAERAARRVAEAMQPRRERSSVKWMICPALIGLLVACTPTPAVISDIETDKVKVQGGFGTTDKMIADKAAEGCAMHDRNAQRISHVCLDNYCIRSEHLFACLER